MTASLAHVRQFVVPLPDGRSLHAYEGGDPSGQLVVVHHGTPGSGLLRREWVEDAREHGIRLVGYDRAGYGGSTRHQGRSVADVAPDIAALADSLGADRFLTWGASGGGPHALACAANLPDRVVAAASVASVAPYDAVGLDFLDGMGQDNLDEFGAAALGEQALRPYLSAQTAGLLAASPESLREAMDGLLSDVDRDALTGETAEFVHGSMTSGLRQSCDGWLDDDLAFVSAWGFDVDSIVVPVLVMQGEQDLMVPFAHGRWLAAAVLSATVRLMADEGHISLAAKVPEVHDWLLSQA
ncbi:MAG: alpha/beta hydrolase [Nocardioidaceae bacterium]